MNSAITVLEQEKIKQEYYLSLCILNDEISAQAKEAVYNRIDDYRKAILCLKLVEQGVNPFTKNEFTL